MRTKILIAGLMLIVALAACTATDTTSEATTSLVASDGVAPYYTDLVEAQAAASADQYLVVDFYTDW
jgi:hypothetical protein